MKTELGGMELLPVPVRDIPIGDSRRDIEHDDRTLTLDARQGEKGTLVS